MNYFFIFVPLVAGLVGLNIWLSKAFWPYHPNGTKGFIIDQLVYNLSPVLLMLLILGLLATLQANAPEVAEGPFKYVLMAVGIFGIFLVRRLPVVAAAQARARAARDARFAAMAASSDAGEGQG